MKLLIPILTIAASALLIHPATAATPAKKAPAKQGAPAKLAIDEPTLRQVLKGTWQLPPAAAGKDMTARFYAFDGNLNLVTDGVGVKGRGELIFPIGVQPGHLEVDAETGLESPTKGPILRFGTPKAHLEFLIVSLTAKKLTFRDLPRTGGMAPDAKDKTLTKISDTAYETKASQPQKPAPSKAPAPEKGGTAAPQDAGAAQAPAAGQRDADGK